MDNQRKPVRLATLMFVLTFASCLLHNFDTNTSPSLPTFTPGKIPIGFGWPMVGVEGMIEYETQQLATSPQQLWNGLESSQIVWTGACIDFLVAIALSMVMFAVTQWLQSRLHVRLTVGVCLGLLSYSALVIRNRQLSWQRMEGVYPDYAKMDLTSALFDYAEIIVWIALLAGCIWLPQYVFLLFAIANGKRIRQ